MRVHRRVNRRVATVLGLALGAVALVLIAGSLRRNPQTAIVIVTLDTTRADRLSPYGFMGVAMPGLERLAREGVLFNQAMSASPLTLPSHCTLFTGLLPPRHGVRDNADSPLAPSVTTMAEIVALHGYRTAAFVSAGVLDADRGLSQGFDVYRAAPAGQEARANRRERRGDDVMTEAVDWLGERWPLAILPVGAPLRSASAVPIRPNRSVRGSRTVHRRARLRRRAGRPPARGSRPP